MIEPYEPIPELLLGKALNQRVPTADQNRQRDEAFDILRRLRRQPGLILADEVGMGKTFVALAVACSIAKRSQRGPVVIMVPANLVDKWEQDLRTFCELYLDEHRARRRADPDFLGPRAIRYGVARRSVEFLKLVDDASSERCHLVFLAQGAMARRQTDKWVRLALIAEALRRHGRGGAQRLIQVKTHIHRFLGELLWAMGEERAHDEGEDLWHRLLRSAPDTWREIYNSALRRDDRRLDDEPVPKAVARALHRTELKPLAHALEMVPVRKSEYVSQRLDDARSALRSVEHDLWKHVLKEAKFRSPLLIMDEAHHLKNPRTALARQLQTPQLQSTDVVEDLRTGDGAMANAFDRMLFLTATPFELGHHELIQVLRRFGDVRWGVAERTDFQTRLNELATRLNDSQRAAIALQRSWSRLQPEDYEGEIAAWWEGIQAAPRLSLRSRQRAVVDAFDKAKATREVAESALRPWIVRHNKGTHWLRSEVLRRRRFDGAAVLGKDGRVGLPIPPQQLLPFFLAARSAVRPGHDLLGEALSSSYEAFRFTRQNREEGKDEDETATEGPDLSHAGWYLGEFDRALERCSGATHPKVEATVSKVVDLWQSGEKVLVFAFYRQTCRALRIHISHEIERRIGAIARERVGGKVAVDRTLERVQRRYFDDVRSTGRRTLDKALEGVLARHDPRLTAAGITEDRREGLIDVMRRFLRVTTTLVRCFPLEDLESTRPEDAVARMLTTEDATGVSWRAKFDAFIEFLLTQCSTDERVLYLEAAQRTQTRDIQVEEEADERPSGRQERTGTLANVQVATGATKRDTKQRLMRAFNTPFFPDVLVCSEVMAEGVDLQRACRHVIHHDLAWNPSKIEQRTGRIDRLGCKAEGRHPIMVYLPYLSGTADERQYRVMCDREQWFRVVMGQEKVGELIGADSDGTIPVPRAIADSLAFHLALAPVGAGS